MTTDLHACSICIEPFNNTRKRIECMHCNLVSCTFCTTTYLQNNSMTPQCMQCHHMWSNQYIRENFGPTFIKKMATIRKETLFVEQQSFFPNTLDYVILRKQKNELTEKYMSVAKDDTISFNKRGSLLNDLARQMRENSRQINAHLYPIRGVNYPENSENEVQQKYIKKCDNGDCNGFVNETTKSCQLCNTEYCTDCMEKKCINHVCKPENVKSITMLRKDTKNCPNCTSLIHRISGCPDMFCVSCKTAFNWNTLKINRQGNSNPHYYQWIRENVSSLNSDQSCRQGINLIQVFSSSNYRNLDKLKQNNISNLINRLHHYDSEYNVKKYYKEYKKTKHYDHSFQMITLHARADYMENKISKEQFTQFLLKINKAIEFNQNIDDILSSIRTFKQYVMANVLYSTTFDYDTLVKEYNNFVKYINNCVLTLEEILYSKKKYKFISL